MESDRRASLIEMLAGYVPIDESESRHLASFRDLLKSNGDPFSRYHYVPGHITASAFVVHRPSRRVLLHHHRRLDRWLQLGGHVDMGEDVAAAALREAAEESGLTDVTLVLTRPFDVDVHFIPAARGESEHRHFDVRFLASTSRPHDMTLKEDESIDLAWLDFDEAERRMNAPESSRALHKIREIVATMR